MNWIEKNKHYICMYILVSPTLYFKVLQADTKYLLTCYGQRKIYQNGVCTTWKCYDFYSKNKTDSVKNKCLLIYSKYPAKFKCLESKIVKIIYKEARVRVNFRHSDVDDIKWAITAQWCNWLISQLQSFRNCYNVISLNETFYMTGFHWSFINAFLVMFY